ncbi:hypothetical protein HYU10_03570, partial [Candidatus Woesearchaeota archaeon]|nr:hypothetical protein [Candidatus Woesearchaeota archaeon]
MAIDRNGNVGINTTAPARTLTVQGTLNVSNPGTSGQLFMDSSGNVGIGTTSPINALTIIGSVTAFGSLNATFINASSIKVGTNDVQTVNAVFNLVNYSAEYSSTGFDNENFTARYDLRTDRYGKLNYSTEYAATGWDRENTSDYHGQQNGSILLRNNLSIIFEAAFDNENFTARYDLRTDRYGSLNYSTEYAATGFNIQNGTRLPFSSFQLSNVSNNTL